MGTGYSLKCRKCGYGFSANLGVGFMFPLVYQETMEAGREGKLGKEVRQFLEEHPDGVLDCNAVMLQCTECGELGRAPDLSMYLPKEGREGASYVAPWNLDEYKLIGRYDHRCSKCKGKMRIIQEKELEQPVGNGNPTKVLCPKCKEPLWLDGILMWD